ncbi:MAG TPA: NADH-quinone oxidoreductase subunit NuoG [Chloroflexota bacterium]|nr:NADH-quinone oxidoreductase subunit NuoG [Chloroflexota bacterium]
MDDLVNITVDGLKMQVPKGTLLWEACQAHGIDIPIFCYHTKLGPVGACRTCLVEVEGMTKGPITACSTPVTDGMVVRTRSPIAQKAQRGILEFLLLNHPLDCPICDRGGECPLQDQTFAYGPGSSRYVEPKRHHVKPIVLGPTIALDRERCVLCWRCVRFTAEIAEDKSIVLLDRGDHTVVGTFQDEPYVSNFSGNVVELCPVGALTARKQRFNFRPWELQNRPSICPHCAFGCNINISVRKNDEVIRFLSRDNPEVDDSWLCDRGRFDFEFINSPQRLTAPLVRDGDAFLEVSWTEAFELISNRLRSILDESGAHALAGIAAARMTNEGLHVFKRFMRDVVGTGLVDHTPRPNLRLTPGQQQAFARLGRNLMPIAGLDDARTILLLGADPSEREPVMELRIRQAVNRHGAQLVIANPEEITLSPKASHAASYETGGLAAFIRSLTSALRRGPQGSNNDDSASALVRTYLAEGPIAVIYDASFPGTLDKGDAVLALDDFVEALRARAAVGTLPLLDAANSMGARDLDILPPDGWSSSVIDALLGPDSQVRAAILAGADLAAGAGEETLRRLNQLDLLVVQELFMTETARLADVVLPAASFAEQIGTFTNSERRVQRLHEAVPAPGVARADWEILVDLSQHFDNALPYAGARQIWDDIRRTVPAYAPVAFDSIGPRGVRIEETQVLESA